VLSIPHRHCTFQIDKGQFHSKLNLPLSVHLNSPQHTSVWFLSPILNSALLTPSPPFTNTQNHAPPHTHPFYPLLRRCGCSPVPVSVHDGRFSASQSPLELLSPCWQFSVPIGTPYPRFCAFESLLVLLNLYLAFFFILRSFNTFCILLF
jgi:hypothetical protein